MYVCSIVSGRYVCMFYSVSGNANSMVETSLVRTNNSYRHESRIKTTQSCKFGLKDFFSLGQF
jgi:hypothetical protein